MSPEREDKDMDRWNLTNLYQSFADDAFAADQAGVSALNDKMNALCERHDAGALREYLALASEQAALLERLSCFTLFSMSADTDDEDAAKAYDTLNNLEASLAADNARQEKWIASFDLDAIDDARVKAHMFILKEIQARQAHALSEQEESLLSHMKTTGAYAWAAYKDKVVSDIKVSVNGKEDPLTDTLNMAYDPDADVRKAAYEAEVKVYEGAPENAIAAALSAIKGTSLYEAKLRGYDSVLSRTLENSRLSQNTLDALLDVMKENMDMFREYYRLKAEVLGHENGLPWYDLYAPVTDNTQSYTYDDACTFVVRHFTDFSAHLGQFARRAIDEHWIDIYPRAGKVGGAFCENIMSLGESRFLLNFGGHFSDLVTMAHELGHGFHGECLKDEPILNTRYPMPIAETASTLCETIVTQAALKEATGDDALAILDNAMSDAAQVIVDIYSRYLFETALFDKREKGGVSAAECCEMMLQAQKDAYGDGLDPDVLHPYMWTWKPHYYDVDEAFYNFPYAFGLLLSKGLYARCLEDPEGFPEAYETFLAKTGAMSLEDVAKTMDIDLTDRAFWRQGMDIVRQDWLRLKELLEAKR